MNRYYEQASFFFFSLSILSLYLADIARAIPSICIGGLIITSFLYFIKNGFTQKLRPELIVLSLGILILYVIQFLTSENIGYLLERLQIKLPIILVPLSLMVIPSFKRESMIKLFIVYIFITLSVAIFIITKFFLNYSYYIDLISKSQVVPGPINHIRFSLMVVSAAYLAYNLKFLLNTGWLSKSLTIIIIFFVIFLHLYAVRSGLLALYFVILFLVLKYLIQKSNLKLWLISLFAIFLLPISIYFLSPSVQQKITATINDYKLYKSNASNENNSLGKRIVSYRIALSVFKDSPLTGCGIGDLDDINRKVFSEKHPDIHLVIIPHNQFIYFLMGSGILGTLIFTFSFFFPFFYNRNYKSEILFIHFLILILSFQTEPMLETQLGVGYALMFMMMGLEWIRTSEVKPI